MSETITAIWAFGAENAGAIFAFCVITLLVHWWYETALQ